MLSALFQFTLFTLIVKKGPFSYTLSAFFFFFFFLASLCFLLTLLFKLELKHNAETLSNLKHKEAVLVL